MHLKMLLSWEGFPRWAGDDNKYSYCETVQPETISGNCQLIDPFGPGKRQNGWNSGGAGTRHNREERGLQDIKNDFKIPVHEPQH